MKKILKVVAQGEAYDVQKKDGVTLRKCQITLQEVGGEYENTFVATMLGNLAACRFQQNELVYAVLYYSVHEYNGQVYQDIVVNEIFKIKN